jgi:hypothetical protein
MKDSIISNTAECYVCHAMGDLHRHHVFSGPNRKLSDQDGCWVYLCPKHHNMSKYGVHFDRTLDLEIKMKTQERWEEINGTREEFRARYGKSWL